MVSRATERLAQRYLVWAGIVLVVLACAGLLWATWGIYDKFGEATAGRVNAEHDRDSLIARKAELEQSVALLATARGVEGEIRARYPMGRPGEKEFVLVDVGTTSVDITAAPRESIWSTIWHWLGW